MKWSAKKVPAFLIIISMISSHSTLTYGQTKTDSTRQQFPRRGLSANRLEPSSEQERAEVFVQLGHSRKITSSAFSADGQYVLSGSEDNTVKLWDSTTGREIRTFKGHSDRVTSVTFSPDGRYALSSSDDSTIRLWDVFTSKELKSYVVKDPAEKKTDLNLPPPPPDARPRAYSVKVSKDGRLILLASSWGFLQTLDAATWRGVRVFSGHESGAASAVFSPDGRYILSGGWDKSMKLWDAPSGREIRTFLGHSENVKSIAFSPDGKNALSGSEDKSLRLWNVPTGREIRILQGHSETVNSVAFSPNGKYALSGSEDKTLRLWDFANGKEVRKFNAESSIGSVCFSPDGKQILSGHENATLKIWDAATGNIVRTLKGYSDGVPSLALTPDGRYVLTGAGASIKLWEIAAGRLAAHIGSFSSPVYCIAVSSDGKQVLSARPNFESPFTLWDVATGREIKTPFKGREDMIKSVVFSADGKYVLSGGLLSMKMWEIATGSAIKTIGYKPGWIRFAGAAFPLDGKSALSWNLAGELKLWDIESGHEIWLADAPSACGAFSPDGRYVLTGDSWHRHLESKAIRLWDVTTGKEIKEMNGHLGYVSAVTFSPDGRYVLSADSDGPLKLWNLATGNEIRTFTGHLSGVRSLIFSSDGKCVVSGSEDGTTRLWNVATGEGIIQMVSFEDGEWIVITPEGYYNSSPNGDKYLNVRVGNNVYGADQYRSTFYKPQVVEAAFRLGSSKQAIAEVLGSGKEKPPVTITQPIEPPSVVIKSPEEGRRLGSRNAEVIIHIEDQNQTIKSVKVYINGRLVTGEENRGLATKPSTAQLATLGPAGIVIPDGKKSLDLKIPVVLESGENLIEAIAFNGFSKGRSSIRAYGPESVGDTKASLPNLWILSVGINDYQDKQIPSLAYAAEDAEGIVSSFKHQEGLLFNTVNSLVINDKASVQPTYSNILDNFNYLRKAGQYDVVLLFLAGHGVNDERGEFFFLPRDAEVLEDGGVKRSMAISWRDIKDMLELPAKVLVFIDACHSEGVSGKKTRAVDTNRLVKELQDARVVVITSSQGKELSQESDKWRHGAFTYALIQGLGGKADQDRNGVITIKELDAFVSEMVPQLTNGAQHPITYTPEGYVNFPISLVKQR